MSKRILITWSIVLLLSLASALKVQGQTEQQVQGLIKQAREHGSSGGGTPGNNNNSSSSGSGSQSKRQILREEAHDINHEGILENNQGRQCYSNQDWDGAIYHFQRAINYYQSAHEMFRGDKTYKKNLSNNVTYLNNSYYYKYANQGNDLLNRGLNSDAEAAYRKALEYDPGNADLLNDVGVALQRQGKNKEAIEFYKKAMKADKHNQYAEKNLNELKAEIKTEASDNAKETEKEAKQQKEEETHQKTVKLNSDANDHFTNGNFKEAEKLYKKAIELNPNNKTLYNNLGRAQLELGKFDAAESAFRKALEIDPKNSIANVNLGIIQYKKCNYQDAEAYCRKVIALDPTNSAGYCGLALAFASEGFPGMALTNFRKAIEMHPDDPAYHNYLAAFLEKQGLFKEATAEYDEVLKVDPNNTTAKESIDKVRTRENTGSPINTRVPGTVTEPGVQLQSSKLQGFDVVIDGNGKSFVGLLSFGTVDGNTTYAEKVPLELAKTEKFQQLLISEGKIREEYAALDNKLKDIQAKKTTAFAEVDKFILEKRESEVKQDMSKKVGEFTMKRFEQTEAIRTFHEEMEETPVKNPPDKKQ